MCYSPADDAFYSIDAVWLMTFHVQRQVIGSTEWSGAQFTPKRLDACVLPEVASQLVGTGETPNASLPYADVGFFACWGYKIVYLYFYKIAFWNKLGLWLNKILI